MLEKMLLRALFLASAASIPFVLKRKNKNLLMLVVVFFAKGVLSVVMDSYFIKNKKIAYPARPFARIFETNILYDLLFYPLLSVIWVRATYNSKPLEMLTRSIYFSVPMSLLQWALEKKTKLFEWKSWTVLHTYASINFTLFTIRGLVGLLRRIIPEERRVSVGLDKRRVEERYELPYENQYDRAEHLADVW